MRAKRKQSGVTLTEMVVVIAVVAVMIGISLPSIRGMYSSIGENSDGTMAMISSALASARAIAIKQQRYAGVRFQKVYRQDGEILKADQYMILVVHEEPKEMGNLAAGGFRAVEGAEPIKLPKMIGVIDMSKGSGFINKDDEIDEAVEVIDRTSFSIIFSESGKLVIFDDAQMRNRDGLASPDNGSPDNKDWSMDDVFNSKVNIENFKKGMFLQDDYPGLDKEQSKRCFVIYEREKFDKAYKNGRAYTDYLKELIPKMIYINRYTGTIVNK